MDNSPDVAVVDISMPGMDGLEVVARLKDYTPEIPVLILTMHDEEQYVVRAVETGVMGYVTKQSAPEQLVDAVKKVFSGSRYLTEKASETLALKIVKGEAVPDRDGFPLNARTPGVVQACREKDKP
ncbi:MAG: response regulator transcription factor [Thermodesulfobacteriota bacterium]|nr:response regulator transcription factor [Thermodesulfobacteriota bacterium]